MNAYILANKEEEGLMQHILHSNEFGNRGSVNTLADYLFSKILESARANPEVSPLTNRLHSMLQDINFLFFKGLHQECYDLIMRATDLAKTLDKATYLLELSIWERRVLPIVKNVGEMSRRIKEMVQEEQILVRRVQTMFSLNSLSNDLFLSQKQGLPVSEFAAAQIRNFLSRDEQAFVQNLSLRAKYWYHNSMYYYYEIQYKLQNEGAGEENLKKAILQLEALVAISENEAKVLAEEERALYYALLDNYLNLCLRLKEYKRADDIEKILASTRNEVQLLRSVTFHRLTHFLSDNEFKKAVEYIEKDKLDKRLRRYEKRIGESRSQAIRYTCGQAHFILGNYDQASDWFFQIVNNARAKANPTARLVSEILHHICHFELNSFPKDPFRPMKNLREKLERSEKNDESTLPKDSEDLRRRKKMADFHAELFSVLRTLFVPKEQLLDKKTDGIISALREKMDGSKTLETSYAVILAWIEARCNDTTVAEEIKKYNK